MTLLLQTHIPESSLFNLVPWSQATPRKLHFLRGHPSDAGAGGADADGPRWALSQSQRNIAFPMRQCPKLPFGSVC